MCGRILVINLCGREMKRADSAALAERAIPGSFLCLPCPSAGTRQFSKEPSLLLVKNGI